MQTRCQSPQALSRPNTYLSVTTKHGLQFPYGTERQKWRERGAVMATHEDPEINRRNSPSKHPPSLNAALILTI